MKRFGGRLVGGVFEKGFNPSLVDSQRAPGRVPPGSPGLRTLGAEVQRGAVQTQQLTDPLAAVQLPVLIHHLRMAGERHKEALSV